jgi:aspartyl protease family protein
MWRLVSFIIAASVFIGAMMPSSPPNAAAPNDDGIIYTPQSSGSSYRIVGEGSGGSRGATRSQGGVIRLQREADGHFYVDARVNGGVVHFLVDTGASGVALTQDDARSAGLSLASGSHMVGEGASGAVMGQWAELDRIEVGDRTISDVSAAVLDGGTQSLLGQEVLREFDIEVHGDEMLLR